MLKEVPTHSETGASSSPRWLKCPGSVRLIRKLKDNDPSYNDSGFPAAEGTVAHKVLSDSLELGHLPQYYINSVIKSDGYQITVDQEMIDGVTLMYDYVESKTWCADKFLIEKKLRDKKYPDDLYGTVDCCIVTDYETDSSTLEVVDFKYGKHVCVEPTSSQLKYYAMLVAQTLDRPVANFVLTVIQPRYPHQKGPKRTISLSAEEMQSWIDNELIPGFLETQNENAALKIGDWCSYCPLNTTNMCPALREYTKNFDATLDLRDLTADEKIDFLTKEKAVSKFFDNIRKDLFKDAMNGIPVTHSQTGEGFKLVNKRSDRIWKMDYKDPETGETLAEKLESALGEKAYSPRSFLSPAQVEKLPGGKKLVTKFAYKPSTGFTIAPLSDSRSSVRPPNDVFEEVYSDLETE